MSICWLLYIKPYEKLDDAIQIQNDVPQGLSSALFSTDMRETEKFLSVQGSDCGIANINIGTSGAEICGAFGGEKIPVAAEKVVQTPGNHTCEGKHVPLTMEATSIWLRESGLTFKPLQPRCLNAIAKM